MNGIKHTQNPLEDLQDENRRLKVCLDNKKQYAVILNAEIKRRDVTIEKLRRREAEQGETIKLLNTQLAELQLRLKVESHAIVGNW